MLKVISLILVMTSSAALAQQAIPQPKGAPVVTITDEDRPVINESLDKLGQFLMNPPQNMAPDPSAAMRVRDVQHNVVFQDEIDLRNVPLLGMALSRNSQDPRACALLQRIEPSAVCVK